jgi:hypothetical protein
MILILIYKVKIDCKLDSDNAKGRKMPILQAGNSKIINLLNRILMIKYRIYPSCLIIHFKS